MLDFINIQGQVLNKTPDDFELAGYNPNDLMFIKAFALEEGVNSNKALFRKDEIEKASSSLVGKPLKIRFINGNPTGHGYNFATNTFDELVRHIGYIYNAKGGYYNDVGELASSVEDSTYKVLVSIVVWQKDFPEIANRLRELHSTSELKFSIEADRDYELTEEGYRDCYNINFNALAVVKNPAWEKAKSLMVAELLKGGKEMDFEKLYNEEKQKNEDLTGKLALETQAKELAEKESVDLKAEIDTFKVEIAELNGNIKDVTAERDNFKEIIELAEKEKVGQERHDKLAKYGDVVQTNEELAEMSTEDFANLLIEKVENYEPTVTQETAEKDEVIATHIEKENISKVNRKEKLLNMIEGFGKNQ